MDNVYTLSVDKIFLYEGQHFVWNEDKAHSNLVKHGVSFENACEVFFDPFVRLQDASVSDERRDAAVGRTENRTVIFVVNLLVEDESIRIISARQATAKERRTYEDCD